MPNEQNGAEGPTKLGAKILIAGYPGTGKTHSLRTIPRDLETYGLFTDHGGIAIGAPFCAGHRFSAPSTAGMDALINFATLVNTSTVTSLVKGYGGDRQNYRQYISLLEQCNNFVDSKGNELGSVFDWGTDRVLWIDHLSGVTKMAKQLTVGNRPILSQPEYGIIQNILLEFIEIIITTAKCHVVFVSHLDVSTNQLTGARELTPATIGQKLGPVLGVNFTDIIMANREGKEFVWQTLTNHDIALKANHVEWSESMAPDFGPLFNRWKGINGGY